MGRKISELPPPVKDFVALDFECLNEDRFTVCEVGAVRYENGVAVEEFHSFVCPPTRYENRYCIKIHGITYAKVKDAPKFPDVWKKIDAMIGNKPIVAHSASYERTCINACGEVFDTPTDYQYIDTLTISRCLDKQHKIHKLNEVCKRLGVPLHHHHCAIDDAKACGEIYLKFATMLEAIQLLG